MQIGEFWDLIEDARKSHPFYRALGLIPHEEQGMAAFALPVKP